MARSSAALPLTRLPIESVRTASRCHANVLPTASPMSRAAGSRYASIHEGEVPAIDRGAATTYTASSAATSRGARPRLGRNRLMHLFCFIPYLDRDLHSGTSLARRASLKVK